MDDMVSMLPPLRWESFLDQWHVRPLWLAFSLLLLVGYVGALVVARRHGVRAVHPARAVCFVLGVALLLFTVSSAIDVYAMAIFWDHMVEHLMLIMVVPALLILGQPITVARAAASTRGLEAVVDGFARSLPVSVLTHPLVGFGLYATVIVGTHLTGFMDAMATHGWLMGAEQWLYLFAGYVYLLPLLGAEPIRWQLPYLGRLALILLGMTPDTVVGIVLLQTTTDLFPVMMAGHPSWAPDPVDDLHIGGALMWAVGDGLMMFFAIGVAIAMIAHPRSASIIGERLEGVRRRTLAEHVSLGGETVTVADDTDVDEDEDVLEAYNRMLARLHGQEQDPSD
jgi:putative membrane protein